MAAERGTTTQFIKRLTARTAIILGSIIIAVLIGRSYGVTGLGKYMLLLVIVQLLARTTSAIGSVLRAHIRKRDLPIHELTGISSSIVVITSMVFIPVIILLNAVGFSHSLITVNDFSAAGISLLGLLVYHTTNGVYTAKNSDDFVNAIRFIAIAVATGYLTYNSYSLWTVIASYGIVTYVIGVLLVLRAPMPTIPGFRTVAKVAKGVPGAFLTSLSSNFHHKLDVLVLGVLIGFKGVGLYEAALQLVLFIFLFTTIVSDYMTLKIQHGSTSYQAAELVRVATTYGAFFAFPVIGVAAVFNEEILQYVFGASFKPAAIVLVALAGTQLIVSYVTPFELALKQIGQEKKLIIIRFLSLIANIVLSVYLIFQYGFIGVIAATAIVEAATLIAYYVIARLNISHTVRAQEIATQISAGIIVTGIIFVVSKLFIINSFREVSAIFILALVLYSFIFISMSHRSRETLFNILQNS